jgi:hypothetical protein
MAEVNDVICLVQVNKIGATVTRSCRADRIIEAEGRIDAGADPNDLMEFSSVSFSSMKCSNDPTLKTL